VKAVEKTGFRPDECLVVEDSERGFRAAAAAGLRCMVVPRGMTGDGEFTQAYWITRNLSDAVDEILKGI
jgi:beta-phosphoglucomutase-like phosphatase (HAD superfamily)